MRGDENQIVVVIDVDQADQTADLLMCLEGDDTPCSALRQAVVLNPAAFAEPVVGHSKQSCVGPLGGNHGNALLSAVKRDALYTHGSPAHRPDLHLREADNQAGTLGENHLMVTIGEACVEKRVTIIDSDGGNAVTARTRKLLECRLLDNAVSRSHDDIARFIEIADIDVGLDLFVRMQFHDVGQRPASCSASSLGDLIDLQPVAAPGIGKEKDIVVGGGHEHVFNEVIMLGLSSRHPFAPASLTAVP